MAREKAWREWQAEQVPVEPEKPPTVNARRFENPVAIEQAPVKRGDPNLLFGDKTAIEEGVHCGLLAPVIKEIHPQIKQGMTKRRFCVAQFR